MLVAAAGVPVAGGCPRGRRGRRSRRQRRDCGGRKMGGWGRRSADRRESGGTISTLGDTKAEMTSHVDDITGVSVSGDGI